MFREFDLDGSGVIEAEELLALGKARRSLGQKQGEWTEEKNARLVKRMDANGDGEIQMSEFVHHFEDALPRAREEFDLVLEQFMEVAQACRARKQQRRESAHSTDSVDEVQIDNVSQPGEYAADCVQTVAKGVSEERKQVTLASFRNLGCCSVLHT